MIVFAVSITIVWILEFFGWLVRSGCWGSILKTDVKGLVNLGYDFSGARVGDCLLQFVVSGS